LVGCDGRGIQLHNGEHVWEVVPRPQDRSVVGSRWIYKIKYATDNSVEKYKARFVAKGYAQKE